MFFGNRVKRCRVSAKLGQPNPRLSLLLVKLEIGPSGERLRITVHDASFDLPGVRNSGAKEVTLPISHSYQGGESLSADGLRPGAQNNDG